MVDFDSEEQQHPVSQGQWQIFDSMVEFDSEEQHQGQCMQIYDSVVDSDSEEQQHQVAQGQCRQIIIDSMLGYSRLDGL